LADGYRAEIDTIETADWYELAATFSDANLYQAWQGVPGEKRFAGVSRLLLKHHDEVVAAAEVRLFRVPLTSRGIAYIRWGPLWQRKGDTADPEVLRQALRALHHEYVVRRGMVLRIVPRLFVEDGPQYTTIPCDEGFSESQPSAKSLVICLAGDLDELRKGFAQKWRNQLNKAEKVGLTLAAGTTLELFDEFSVVYREMLHRKGFAPTADIHKHRRLQGALPQDLKMGVVLARDEGRPCAGVIYSAIGETAIFVFGATNEAGMQTCASYLLQWETLKLLKDKGVREYDLHGINPELNPGTYHFKKGLAGKNGREVTFVGQLQAFNASLTNASLLLAERLLRRARTSRSEAVGT